LQGGRHSIDLIEIPSFPSIEPIYDIDMTKRLIGILKMVPEMVF